MIDSFSGPKANSIQKAVHVSHQSHFYPSGARMMQLHPATELKKRQERHTHAINKLDDTESVSKCSVRTTMTEKTDQSSFYSKKSKQSNCPSTVSTQAAFRIHELEAQLEAERQRRLDCEQ